MHGVHLKQKEKVVGVIHRYMYSRGGLLSLLFEVKLWPFEPIRKDTLVCLYVFFDITLVIKVQVSSQSYIGLYFLHLHSTGRTITAATKNEL